MLLNAQVSSSKRLREVAKRKLSGIEKEFTEKEFSLGCNVFIRIFKNLELKNKKNNPKNIFFNKVALVT